MVAMVERESWGGERLLLLLLDLRDGVGGVVDMGKYLGDSSGEFGHDGVELWGCGG